MSVTAAVESTLVSQVAAAKRVALVTDDLELAARVFSEAARQIYSEVQATSLGRVELSTTLFMTTALAPVYARPLLDTAKFPIFIERVTPQSQARAPELMEVDSEAIVITDSSALTLSVDTVSWKAFAPVIRASPYVFMRVPYSPWPAGLPHVELLHHFDKVVMVPGEVRSSSSKSETRSKQAT